MTPTTLIALYAAVVATAAILWQVYTRLSDRRTVVTVKLEHEVTYQGEEGVVATVANRGFRAVQVVSVAIEGNEGRWPEYGGGWLRGEQSEHGVGERGVGNRLESLERVRTGFSTEELEDDNFDLHRPVRAVVTLGDGTAIRSNSVVVKP